MISNSGKDERGKYSGGVAGDQGGEWTIRTWYNRPWNCVLRHPDANVRAKIAELSRKAALNNKIGYDQGQRNTYWTQLQKVGYDPSKITVACEADCSAGVIANVKAVGYLLGINALKSVNATYTGNMRAGFKNAGFTVLTASKYLTSDAYLLPGDILLNDSAHTAVNLDKGSKASATSTPTTSNTKLTVDGYWGIATTRRLQVIFGTTVDGIISNQWACYKYKNPGLDSVTFDWRNKPNGSGSQLIKAMQKWAGMKASDCDGEIGDNTIKAFQRKLGTTVDGYVSAPSNMVKALQRWANAQK